jgi:hypothetical protein
MVGYWQSTKKITVTLPSWKSPLRQYRSFTVAEAGQYSSWYLSQQAEVVVQDNLENEKKRKDAAVVKLVCAPRAQLLYRVSREGIADLRPAPVGKAGPWESLSSVSSAPLLQWTIHCSDIVIVDIGPRGEDFAKVSELRRLPDGRYVVVYTWLYIRRKLPRNLK